MTDGIPLFEGWGVVNLPITPLASLISTLPLRVMEFTDGEKQEREKKQLPASIFAHELFSMVE